ncbi:MAG TPA: transcriptional repressor [Pseudorhodoplanes sp.]|nr:transcriptional repressor [Pseudorhodoplanes sp.]
MVAMQPVFPKPDHDHGRCSATALRHAEDVCEARSEKLTPMRRQVLEALLAEHKPLGAYELIDRLAGRGGRPAPITVYRALDFLVEQGFAHRIESRNAFVACISNHEDGELVVFLLCEKCGAVGEAPSRPVAEALRNASRGVGFSPKAHVIEIGGVCAHCRKA